MNFSVSLGAFFVEFIVRLLGTPSEQDWEGVSQLPDWKDSFPMWHPQALTDMFPKLNAHGVDLLKVSV
jgi:hypothetical protein